MNFGNPGNVESPKLSEKSWKPVKMSNVVADDRLSNDSEAVLLMLLLPWSMPSVLDEAISQSVDGKILYAAMRMRQYRTI